MNVFREFMEGVFSNPDNNKIFEFLLNFKSCFLSVGANLLLAQTFVPSFLPLSLSLSLSLSLFPFQVNTGWLKWAKTLHSKGV